MTRQYCHTRFVAVVALATVVCADGALAETVTLQNGLNGYSGTTDTTIYEDFPSNSAGGVPWVYAGDTQFNDPRRALIKFDFTGQIPAGLTVTSASLRLYIDQGRVGSHPASLHRLTRSWNEGTNMVTGDDPGGKGAPAQPGDTTWSHVSFSTVAWASAGGEFVAESSATGTAGNAGTWLVLDGEGLADDIQGLLAAPATNYGWILRVNEESTWNAKRFFSSESTDPRRPALVIDYSPLSAVPAWQLY